MGGVEKVREVLREILGKRGGDSRGLGGCLDGEGGWCRGCCG